MSEVVEYKEKSPQPSLKLATAKASAYSAILTFFPLLLVIGAVLATSRRTEEYLREISYALGSLNENLPTFVVLPDSRGLPYNSKTSFSSGFLPVAHQGTIIKASSPNP